MSVEERRMPESEEEKAVLVRDEHGGARLVSGGNIVEGEFEEDALPDAPPSP